MSYILNTWRDPYDEGFSTTNVKQVTLNEGLNVLVGCNGSGKSTFIRNLKEQVEKENIPHIMYDNLYDGGSNNYSELVYSGHFEFLSSLVTSSEGESITLQICKLASCIREFLNTGETPKTKRIKKMRKFFNDEEDKEEKEFISNKRFILLDAVDSGYSVDNVVDLKENFFNLILEDAKNLNLEVYIIIAANEYELARGEQCIDVMSGKYVSFKDYEDYRKFILNSRKRKENRLDAAKRKIEKKEHKERSISFIRRHKNNN